MAKPREGKDCKVRYNIVLDPALHKEMIRYCLDKAKGDGNTYSISRLIAEAVNDFMYRNQIR